MPAYHRHTQHLKSIRIRSFDNVRSRQHRVIRTDERGILSRLLDRLHLLLAAGMVERANDDVLAEQYILRCGQLCL